MDSRSEDTPKQTPGPWEYRKMPQSGYIVFQTWDVPTAGYVKTEADAQLIAAAPEMLEALKELRKACWGGCACTDPSDEENAAWDIAEATIAKAEGRTP